MAHRSSSGYAPDVGQFLSDIYKDDVMQPKPCAKTKQQDHGIKTLFEKLRIKDSPEV